MASSREWGRDLGSKTNTTTQQQSTSPPAAVLAQYQDLIKRAQGVSQGPTQAGITPLQNQAWGAFGAIPGQYEGNALTAAGRAGAPISQADIQRYENPYQQDVINATMGNLRETDAQQSNQVKGNALAQGALGGSREAVAQGELARQQDLANGQTFAGLNAANYQQGVAGAQADRDAAARSAGLYGGLEANAAGVAGSQLQAGTAQQQANQSQLTQPYQQAQWLAQIEGALGPAEGNTTSGTTTTPGPSVLQQILGGGLVAAGIASGNPGVMSAASSVGSSIGGKARGGGVRSYASGGGIQKPSRAHEMMQNALDIAQAMKAGISGGSSFGGSVNPGIGVRGYDDGGGVFPSWMFDPSQTQGGVDPGVQLLERGTGRVLSGPGDNPSLGAPPQAKLNVDRVPLSPPTLAAVTPQTGIAANTPPPPLDMDAAGMSGADAGVHPSGAPPVQMAAGLNGGPDQPIMLDQVSVKGGPLGQGGPGGIADSAVPYDTSGTSPRVLGGIAAQKAQSQGAPEWSLPLISAGLGILASRSPNLGVALGEGGLQGVNQLMAQRKMTFDQSLAQRDYDLKAKQLENQVSQFQQNFGLQSAEAAKPVLAGYGPDGYPVYEQLNKDTGKYEPANLGGNNTNQPPTAPLAPPDMLSKYNLVADDKEAQRFSAVPEMYRQDAAGLLSGTVHISDIPAVVRMGGASVPLRRNAINYAKAVDPTYDEQAERSGQSLETSPKAQQYVTNVKRVMDTATHFGELSDKVDRSNFVLANNGLLALKAGVSDPDTLAMMSDYTILADEAGKILGSGQGSDFAIKMGQSLTNPAASKAGVHAQLDEIQGRLQNTLVHEKEQFRQNPAKWSPPDAGPADKGPSGKPLPPDMVAKVAKARAAGRTDAEIADALKKDGY